MRRKTKDDAQGEAAASCQRSDERYYYQRCPKKNDIINEWALSKSETVTEGAVGAAGGPLSSGGKMPRASIYPHIDTLARKNLAVQASSICRIRTRIFRRRTCFQQAQSSGVGEGGGYNFPSRKHGSSNSGRRFRCCILYGWTVTYYSVTCRVPSGFCLQRSEGWPPSIYHACFRR